jgi:hypothetical protein
MLPVARTGEAPNAKVAANWVGRAKSDALAGHKEVGSADARKAAVGNAVALGDRVTEAGGDADGEGTPGQSSVFIAKIQNDAVLVIEQWVPIMMPVVMTVDEK